jgi:hypothetical protein
VRLPEESFLARNELVASVFAGFLRASGQQLLHNGLVSSAPAKSWSVLSRRDQFRETNLQNTPQGCACVAPAERLVPRSDRSFVEPSIIDPVVRQLHLPRVDNDTIVTVQEIMDHIARWPVYYRHGSRKSRFVHSPGVKTVAAK